MSLLKNIALGISLVSTTVFLGSCQHMSYYAGRSNSIPKLEEFDKLEKQLYGGSYYKAVQLSRDNPTNWSELQRKYDDYVEMKSDSRINAGMAERNNYMKKSENSFNTAIASLIIGLLSFAAYVDNRRKI